MTLFTLIFLSCEEQDQTVALTEIESSEMANLLSEIEDLKAELDTLRTTVAELQENPEPEPSADSGAPAESYSDEDAIVAIQNSDPWNNPDEANIQYLWSQNSYGYQFLENSRWTMDNRSDPAGSLPRHELIQIFHETAMCTENSSFSDCNGTAGIKIYANGPQIVDHDWSDSGYAAAALRTHHTHASGMYIVSFGQASTVTDYEFELIPPSGIHLEPHGAHQALRIDGVTPAAAILLLSHIKRINRSLSA